MQRRALGVSRPLVRPAVLHQQDVLHNIADPVQHRHPLEDVACPVTMNQALGVEGPTHACMSVAVCGLMRVF